MALYTKVDYQTVGLSSNQIEKKNKYRFAKLFDIENYKKWARKMIFALKGLRL